MKKITSSLIILCLATYSSTFTLAQTTQPTSPQMAFGILDGTLIKLRIGRTMSSADAKTGESVDFEVLEDIKVGDVIVVPRGGTALGTVTNAKHRGRMGKGGKLDINIDYVRLIDGEKAALRAVKETRGGTRTTAMTGAIVASAIVFFPAAPLFLFIKGKDITIPKGTEITAYVNGDIQLDAKNFFSTPNGVAVPSTTTKQQPSTNNSSSAIVKSNPDGAEILIDGKFVGSTPSTLQLQSGEHTISLKKVGYTLWERTISLSAGGSITVDATLEKTP